MATTLKIAGAFALLLLVVVGLYQIAGRYILGYRIADAGIQIVLVGRLPVWQMRYSTIRSLEPVGWWSATSALLALRLGNRPFGRGVCVHRGKGFFRQVLITPDDPERFASDVAERLASRSP